MAPMTLQPDSYPQKRTSSFAQFAGPVTKKINRGPVRHHKPSWDLQKEQRRNATIQDDEAVQDMLTHSISLTLDAVGFEAATPQAVECFRADVEEYMAHFLTDVRQSMLSCRRTQPVPQDILQALHTHQLSLRSLLPHLDPPVLSQQSQYRLQTDSAQEPEHQHFRFLGPVLNSAPDEHAQSYVPKHFPEFPSKHTYKSTEVFPVKESDPRKVRERAAEEGRLGEEALRRLVSAASDHPAQKSLQQQGPKSMRARRDQMWMETMKALTEVEPEAMDIDGGAESSGKGKQKESSADSMKLGCGSLHTAVNSEKKYWRKPVQHRLTGTAGEINK